MRLRRKVSKMGSRKNIESYLTNSLEEQNKNSRERSLFNTIPVIIKDFPPDNVSINDVLAELEARIPLWFFQEVDVVYIGTFDMFIERQVEAIYEDGAIYVFNEQPTTEDFIESIGHEIAHALETQRPEEIYGDQQLEAEFVGKRRRLRDILAAHGYQYTDGDFLDPEYDTSFDDFLYKDVGYPTLTSLSSGLFMSPYAATSLREYYANGFEWFFLKDEKVFLKKISPMLYYKLDILSNM